MKLHLYQLSKAEAFSFSKEVLGQLGFDIIHADERKGVIASSRQLPGEQDVLFFNILYSNNMPYATMNLISNIFTGAGGIFIAMKGIEESFCDCLNELMNKSKGQGVENLLEIRAMVA